MMLTTLLVMLELRLRNTVANCFLRLALIASQEPQEERKIFDSETNNWGSSSLREYLNNDFYKKIVDEIGKENILPFGRDLLSLDGQNEYGVCEDYVSILSVDDYRQYRKLIPNIDKWWWLLTPWSTPCNGYKIQVSVVSPSGNVFNDYCYNGSGVRPLCIFSPNLFESE